MCASTVAVIDKVIHFSSLDRFLIVLRASDISITNHSSGSARLQLTNGCSALEKKSHLVCEQVRIAQNYFTRTRF